MENDVRNCLKRAVINGNISEVELLGKGVNLNEFKYGSGRTSLLHIATSCANAEMVTLLLSYGIDCNSVDKDGQTALNSAALRGYIKVAKILIDAGTDVNLADNEKTSPLNWACVRGHVGMAKLLLAAGADFNFQNDIKATPLYQASWSGHIKSVELLLSVGADPSLSAITGQTPLHSVLSCFGHAEIAKLLLRAGANPNSTDNDGSTPLCALCRGKHIYKRCSPTFPFMEMLKALFEAGANFSTPNKSGQTPILWASAFGSEEEVKFILDAGADPTLADKDGETPLSRALKKDNQRVAKLLKIWPRVVPLRTLCLRVIHVKTNKVTVPEWVPPVLLEWPSVEEVTGVSLERPSKRQK